MRYMIFSIIEVPILQINPKKYYLKKVKYHNTSYGKAAINPSKQNLLVTKLLNTNCKEKEGMKKKLGELRRKIEYIRKTDRDWRFF